MPRSQVNSLLSAYPHVSPVLGYMQAGEGAGGGVVDEHGGTKIRFISAILRIYEA